MALYIAIDLKSFYASVECVERGLDPLTTNLVVADESRTEKTICLAVTPALKKYGVPGRARLFEVNERVREINADRKVAAGGKLEGEAYDEKSLEENKKARLAFHIAPPRMGLYLKYSANIYSIYLRFVAKEDIHVYSIDEVFMDVTHYLNGYGMTAKELARKIILEVYKETGITATAGIGTNLYLCKVAMDIVAKHAPADEYGVRIAELDEESYRRTLWDHKPITDFWRVGRGYRDRLEKIGIATMGDIALRSVKHEDDLYDIFGVNAELLIDHAWGWEPCTIADIKSYRPLAESVTQGQVLSGPYTFEKARLVAEEMADVVAFELVAKGLATDHIDLTVGYDVENDPVFVQKIGHESGRDHYGRTVPKAAHGSVTLDEYTSSSRVIVGETAKLFDSIVDKRLTVRRMYIAAMRLKKYGTSKKGNKQLDMFTDNAAEEKKNAEEELRLQREHCVQEAVISIRKRYGKNAIVKGMNMEEGATAMERNGLIGGHKK